MGLTEKEIKDLILTNEIEKFVNAPKNEKDEDEYECSAEELFSAEELDDFYASGRLVKDEEDEEKTSIDDVLNEMFANGSVDRDSYVKSIMVLTRAGYVNSDLKSEEDVKDSKFNGFEVNGLTDKGRKYVDKVLADEKMRHDVKQTLAKCDKFFKDATNSGIVQFGATMAGIFK